VAALFYEIMFYDGPVTSPDRDARVAGPELRRDRRREAAHQYAWIRSGGAWRAGVVVAWFRDGDQWCCWVQHDHPAGRPWPMFEMYVYEPETIVPRDPWNAVPPSLARGARVPSVDREQRRQFVRDHRTCVFGYARQEHGPAMTVVYYLTDGDNELLVSTMAARGKAKAVARGRKVSLCILDETWPFSYLQVYGTAELDRDRELAADVLARVVGLMAGEDVPDSRRPQIAELAAQEQRVVIRVKPYATFETPPRHVAAMSDIDTLTHWTSSSMPW
jgi:nitroimidazol reductase NimA-like FMN-containing flavoprotein (pyridoxamine 5'-phosphate oxidase superfamily)